MNKRKILLIALLALVAEYLICVHLAYYMFSNTDVSKLLFVLCVLVAVLAVFFTKTKLILCTVAGYGISFALGVVCNYDYIGPHVTTMQTWYIWFLLGVLVSFAVGLVWEIVIYLYKKVKK